jgi:hypothetical protein
VNPNSTATVRRPESAFRMPSFLIDRPQSIVGTGDRQSNRRQHVGST